MNISEKIKQWAFIVENNSIVYNQEHDNLKDVTESTTRFNYRSNTIVALTYQILIDQVISLMKNSLQKHDVFAPYWETWDKIDSDGDPSENSTQYFGYLYFKNDNPNSAAMAFVSDEEYAKDESVKYALKLLDCKFLQNVISEVGDKQVEGISSFKGRIESHPEIFDVFLYQNAIYISGDFDENLDDKNNYLQLRRFAQQNRDEYEQEREQYSED